MGSSNSISHSLILLAASLSGIYASTSKYDRWKTHGCYTAAMDSEAPLQLRAYWPNDTELAMSLSACFEECAFQLWEGRYFGLSQQGGCHCGTRLQAAAAKLLDSKCGDKCPDMPLETCGGVGAMQVFVTDKVPRLPARVLGCFMQTNEKRVFHDEEELRDPSFMSHARCATYCMRTKRTRMFGLINRHTCFCGDTFLSGLVRIPYSLCYHPCANYNFDACGDRNAMLVLELHQVTP